MHGLVTGGEVRRGGTRGGAGGIGAALCVALVCASCGEKKSTSQAAPAQPATVGAAIDRAQAAAQSAPAEAAAAGPDVTPTEAFLNACVGWNVVGIPHPMTVRELENALAVTPNVTADWEVVSEGDDYVLRFGFTDPVTGQTHQANYEMALRSNPGAGCEGPGVGFGRVSYDGDDVPFMQRSSFVAGLAKRAYAAMPSG